MTSQAKASSPTPSNQSENHFENVLASAKQAHLAKAHDNNTKQMEREESFQTERDTMIRQEEIFRRSVKS